MTLKVRYLWVLSLSLFLVGKSSAAPAESFVPDREIGAPSRWIDAALAAKWKEEGLKPSGRISDAEFIRRATLDVIGRIPTPAEVCAFEFDTRSNHRGRLIDRLLAGEEYGRYWSELWTSWLTSRAADPVCQDRLRGWLEREFRAGTSHRHLAMKLLTATGKSSDNGAAAFVQASRGMLIPARNRPDEGQFDMIPFTARSMRVFLGIQVDCLRCHDHPFTAELKQKHFWGLNTFFRQVELQGAERPGREAFDPFVGDNPKLNSATMAFYENRRGVVLAVRPTYLDGKKTLDSQTFVSTFAGETAPKRRREQLADFVVDDRRFAEAFVNRIWSQFFGRSMTVNPQVDDFGEHNEVAHPELLAKLAKEFARTGYDPRRLIRWLCDSQAYQLSCVPNATNGSGDAEPFSSRMMLKPLNTEQLFGAALTAARSPNVPAAERVRLHALWTRALRVHEPDGNCDEALPDGMGGEPLSTLIALLNSPEFVEQAVNPDSGIVPRLARLTGPGRIAAETYVAVLGRSPTVQERARLDEEIDAARKLGNEDLRTFWHDLFWALVNSNEFYLNH